MLSPCNSLEEMKYKTDFLDTVICRVDFYTHVDLGKDGPPDSFYTAVKEQFPIVEVAETVGTALVIQGGLPKQQETTHREWIYHGKERTKKLTVTNNCIFIDLSKYEYYDSLKSDFLMAVNALNQTHGQLRFSRLGLRYIDNIRRKDTKDPFKWDDLLQEKLVSGLAIASDPKTISRAFSVLEFNYGDHRLKFQYGIFNEDFPAPVKKSHFILDYDMSTQELLDVHDLAPRLDAFHKKLIESFEEVITQNLRDIMGQIEVAKDV